MNDNKYVLWIKNSSLSPDDQKKINQLKGVEGIESVAINQLENSAISRKEAIMAVSLSVTANFATDAIKSVIDILSDRSNEEVVYCRRPDGGEIDLKELQKSQ